MSARTSAALCLLVASRAAWADDTASASEVRVTARADLFFRVTPQARLTVEETPSGVEQRYWRALTTAPLYARAAVDVQGLAGGRVEAHLAGFGAVDLAVSTEQPAAGDLALAWARVSGQVLSGWGGRRFVEWGLPGGLHVDGIGAEVRPLAGLSVEALVGRPVSPRYTGSLGPVGAFDGAAAAWGLRARYLHAGRLAVALAWMERWQEGIPGQRIASADAVWSVSSRVDVRGAVMLDAADLRVVQARGDVVVVPTRRWDVTAGWSHADVAALIPRWSILSAFAGPVYDEVFAGATWRATRGFGLGAEAALRVLDVPGRTLEQQGPPLATRFDVRARFMAPGGGPQGLVHFSRRDDGVASLSVLRASAAFPVAARLDAMVEAAAALDGDDFTAPRSAYYGRVGAEVHLGEAWRVGATVDVARAVTTPLELRAALHATWLGGNTRRLP